MLRAEERESRPTRAKVEAASISTAIKTEAHSTDLLAEVDALAEHLHGRLVVQVTIGEDRRRTTVYRSAEAAERAVLRAQSRGEHAHVTLVQMLPVGVVVGLGDPR